MSVIAIVPARGGSKGIPDKNIRMLAGKPLLQYTLEAAKESGIFDQIIVSSDSEKILSIAQSMAVGIRRRPDELASDSAPTDPVIHDVIQHYELYKDDVLVLLQPTSPLRDADDIKSAFDAYQTATDATSLISVYEVSNHYLYAYSINGEYLSPVMPEFHAISRRQDLPKIYLPNGAIYIFRVRDFMQSKKIPKSNMVSYLMPAERSIDIDDLDDWKAAQNLLLNSRGTVL